MTYLERLGILFALLTIISVGSLVLYTYCYEIPHVIKQCENIGGKYYELSRDAFCVLPNGRIINID